MLKKILANFIRFLSYQEIKYLDRILHQSILDRSNDYTEHLQYFYWENQIDIWNTVSSPVRPNAEEIKIYKKILTKIPGEKNILLLGSTPEIRDIFMSFPAAKVYLADFSYRMPLAMLKFTKNTDPANEIWVKANWLDLPFSKNFFDVVMGDLVLQQFPPPVEELFLKKISGILKPTGHFISRFNFISHEMQTDSLESIIKKTLSKPYGFWTKAILIKLHALWLYADPNNRLLNRQISAAAFEKFVKDNNIKDEVIRQVLRWIIADKNSDRNWSPPTKGELMRKISSTFSVGEIQTAGDYKESIYYPILDLKKIIKK